MTLFQRTKKLMNKSLFSNEYMDQLQIRSYSVASILGNQVCSRIFQMYMNGDNFMTMRIKCYLKSQALLYNVSCFENEDSWKKLYEYCGSEEWIEKFKIEKINYKENGQPRELLDFLRELCRECIEEMHLSSQFSKFKGELFAKSECMKLTIERAYDELYPNDKMFNETCQMFDQCRI